MLVLFFFFKQKTAYEMRISDWSSDVCSSDLHAAKFAVEGISEALAGELQPFGIRVLIVEPGPFRTDFLGRSIAMAANQMPEYAASSRKRYRETNDGNQAGDPDKAVAVIQIGRAHV